MSVYIVYCILLLYARTLGNCQAYDCDDPRLLSFTLYCLLTGSCLNVFAKAEFTDVEVVSTSSLSPGNPLLLNNEVNLYYISSEKMDVLQRAARDAHGHDAAAETTTVNSYAATTAVNITALSERKVKAPAILFITLTLLIGAFSMMAIRMLDKYIMIPYTVVCLLIGCAYRGITYKFPNLDQLTIIKNTSPETFLLVFLPILIFESAFCMQTHLFKKLSIHMLIIGTVGMGISFVSVAYISYGLLHPDERNWTIYVSFVFSAAVSAIDPVPAIAILEESGSAKSLMIILEGTSLFSEATSVVLFKLFLQFVSNASGETGKTGDMEEAARVSSKGYVDASKEVGAIFQMILGGPAWGFVVAITLTTILSHMTNMWEAELICILAAPFVTYWCADAVFKISGALAVLVLGLWMSSHRAVMSPQVVEIIYRIWEFLSVLADTLIYGIFGVLIIDIIGKTDTAGHATYTADDWWLVVVISVVVIAVRGVVFCIMQPLLVRIGFGSKVFTWPHIFVLVWGGFRGAVTLTLGLMASENPAFKDADRNDLEVAHKILFHTVGVVAFTLIVNASTMRYLMKKLGVLDLPLAKVISMNIAIQSLKERQKLDIEEMSADRYMADTDWKRVERDTALKEHDFGDDESEKFRILSMHYQARESRICLDCDDGEGTRLLPEQIAEMESIARVRLVKAKKMTYWKQYKEGTLSQRGVEHLDDLTDIVLHKDSGFIGSDDIVNYLRRERWSGLKKNLATFQRYVTATRYRAFGPPEGPWRLLCYKIVVSDYFEWFMYGIIVVNVVENIVDLAMSSTIVTRDTSWQGLLYLYMNLAFLVVYTSESFLKIAGLRWPNYWGLQWVNWNRLDLFMLLITYMDLSLSLAAAYGNQLAHPPDPGAVKFFRYFRLVRFFRLIKLIKPLVPFLLSFFDERVNSHFFFAYDVARAFIIGQEETDVILPTLIGYKPLIKKIKRMTEADATIISKEIGLMNERRPDVASAVKTRQAARCVLNSIQHTITQLRLKGILDDHNVAQLNMGIEDQLKKIRHFPHSILVLGGRERLWNVPWINGNRQLFEVIKTLFVEKKFKRGEKIAIAGRPADGIYFIADGVVFLDFPKIVIDNELGEIYDSDNFEVTFDHVDRDISLRSDYVLPGSVLNVQSAMLGMPRRSDAVCETTVAALFLDTATLVKTLTKMSALESRLWRRIAVCVALNILIKLGVLIDSSSEFERSRLSRGAVRLIRKGVHVVGLEQFVEVFLISGKVREMTTINRNVLYAPAKVPAAYLELEITNGQFPLMDEHSFEIYPEYAVLLIVPPGDHDISTINVHDSQANVMTDMNTNQTINTSVRRTSKLGNRVGASTSPPTPTLTHSGMGTRKPSDVGEIVELAKEEKRRRSTVTYNAMVNRKSTDN